MRICFHIYSTGKVVILYSRLCVLQVIIELRKLGGGGGESSLIKKTWYWTTLIPSDSINDHFSTKDVDDTYF